MDTPQGAKLTGTNGQPPHTKNLYTRVHSTIPQHHHTHNNPTAVAVVIAPGKRPVPYRTRKLSLDTPMVLHPPGCGRVGHHRHPPLTRGPHHTGRGPSTTPPPHHTNHATGNHTAPTRQRRHHGQDPTTRQRRHHGQPHHKPQQQRPPPKKSPRPTTPHPHGNDATRARFKTRAPPHPTTHRPAPQQLTCKGRPPHVPCPYWNGSTLYLCVVIRAILALWR